MDLEFAADAVIRIASVAQVVLAGEDGGVSLIRTIADFRRHNRDAQAERVDWSPDTFHRFAASVQQFRDDLDRYPVEEEPTQGMAQGFETMARALAGLGLKTDSPSAANLIEALDAPTPASCFRGSGGPRKLQAKTKWGAAFSAAGLPKAGASAAYDIVVTSFTACHAAFQTLMATLASVALARVSDDMDGLLTEWRDCKRATARLDFDDLLYAARDLLAVHEAIPISRTTCPPPASSDWYQFSRRRGRSRSVARRGGRASRLGGSPSR